jgi:ATP-dependent DNA helicase PIF1
MTQQQALEILQTGANVFLTGSPGSGKTHTIRQYIEWLRSHSIEPSITASTGVAATHIQGITIHSWSGIGITEHFSPYELDRIASKEPVAKRVQKATVLIIDEISMLSGTVLDAVDAVCRQIRGNDHPFGGLQVIMVGDFFQLPPIGRRDTRVPFAFQSSAWQSLRVVTCYLTEQHRQEDSSFLRLLEAIRSGEFAEDEAELLMERKVSLESVSEDIPRLYTHNADVDRINDIQLKALPGNAHIFTMESQGRDTLVESLKRGCLSPERLTLKEGTIVMCTKNNAALGYANGTLGRIVGFDVDSGYPLIETYDERTIMISPSEWIVEDEGKIRAKITQIPLRLAWAITVHKSQGQSLDAAAMDLSRAFEFGQGYVALSRVRSLEGLHLLGWSAQAVAVHPLVREHDLEFQEASEAAEELFGELESAGERVELEQNFIKSSGGTLIAEQPKEKKPLSPRQNTYEESLSLIKEGHTIEEISSMRSLNTGTIADHVEKLAASGRLNQDEVESLLPDSVAENFADIANAFSTLGFEQLSPVYRELEEQYTYDELKLARARIKNFALEG